MSTILTASRNVKSFAVLFNGRPSVPSTFAAGIEPADPIYHDGLTLAEYTACCRARENAVKALYAANPHTSPFAGPTLGECQDASQAAYVATKAACLKRRPPTAADHAFNLGYTLGYAFTPASAPRHFTAAESNAFNAGYDEGHATAEDEALEEFELARIRDGEMPDPDMPEWEC